MSIRLVVIDDNPHLAWEGRAYPVNATFQHFVAGLLDLPGSPVATITSCVPLREADGPPPTRPLDPRIQVVGTVPFDGIAGYLRHLPTMLRANRDFCAAELRSMPGVTVPEPDGAFYLFPKIQSLSDSFDFCKRLLLQTKVGLAPGVAFGNGGEGSVRLCYAVEKPILASALGLLREFLKNN